MPNCQQLHPNPSYSPILGKKAMDVAESRNLIHGSDCDTESRIN